MKKAWQGVERWLGIRRRKTFALPSKFLIIGYAKRLSGNPEEEHVEPPELPKPLTEAERFRLIAGEDAISEEEQRMRRLFNE